MWQYLNDDCYCFYLCATSSLWIETVLVFHKRDNFTALLMIKATSISCLSSPCPVTQTGLLSVQCIVCPLTFQHANVMSDYTALKAYNRRNTFFLTSRNIAAYNQIEKWGPVQIKVKDNYLFPSHVFRVLIYTQYTHMCKVQRLSSVTRFSDLIQTLCISVMGDMICLTSAFSFHVVICVQWALQAL